MFILHFSSNFTICNYMEQELASAHLLYLITLICKQQNHVLQKVINHLLIPIFTINFQIFYYSILPYCLIICICFGLIFMFLFLKIVHPFF